MHRLTKAQARRIAVRAQLLDAPRPTDLLAVVQRLTLLQIDPTAAIAPSADLVAWSRLGSAYQPAHLRQALEQDRTLFEHNALVRPMSDLGLYLAGADDWPSWERTRAWIRDNDPFRRDILDLLGTSGPLTSRDIPDTSVVPWASTGWTNNRNVTQMLECLMMRGEVAIAGRVGRERLWNLAERVYPADVVVPSPDDAHRAKSERRLASLGIARQKTRAMPLEPTDVGEAGEPAVVEGVKGEWRVDPAALGEDFEGRTALLSPFDRLLHDRVRAEELFDFEYTLEMYKPADKRRWGYFALPILHHDQLVGKLDATADRKASVLRVHAIHEDVKFTRAMTKAVRAELEDLASWLELEIETKTHEGGSQMNMPPIVSPEEWKAAREELLVKEKELTRARDALAAERRRMPRMAVEKDYRFEGPNGPASLLDLFEGRRQLVVYRFFYAPDVTTAKGGAYPERACVGCSFLADQVAHLAHLNARDTTLAFVSRAPQADIQGLKERMGWEMPWYTITDDFDADFGVDEWHGTNAFLRDGDRIFRTYFVESRGDEAMGSTWSYLDITALGRQEEWEDSPEGYPQTAPYEWWNYHDAYGAT